MLRVLMLLKIAKPSVSHILPVLTTVLFLVLFPGTGMTAQDSNSDRPVPENILRAAHSGLMPFLRTIPPENFAQYGIPDGINLEDISLGAANRVYTVDFASSAGNPVDKLSSMLAPTSMWFFETTHDGVPCCILTVDDLNGEYRAVAIGSAGIAKELHQLEQEYPGEAGYSRVFVRVFRATSDLVLVTREGESEKVAGLVSARISLELEEQASGAHTLWDSQIIATKLTTAVDTDIEQQEETR